MGLKRIEPSESLASIAYGQLREAIITAEFRPGDALVIEDLCAQLNISRTPIREALAMLAKEGLVETIPHRGAFVAIHSAAEYEETLPIMERLEGLAVELAIEHIPDVEIERVRSLILDSLPRVMQGDDGLHIRCNREFHALAPRYCQNKTLAALLTDLLDRDARNVFNTPEMGPRHMVVSADEHLELLEAYRKRDRQLAVELMVRHQKRASERYLTLLREEIKRSGEPESIAAMTT